MPKGGAVEGIIPPEPLGVSPPFPISLYPLSVSSAGSFLKEGKRRGEEGGDVQVNMVIRLATRIGIRR